MQVALFEAAIQDSQIRSESTPRSMIKYLLIEFVPRD